MANVEAVTGEHGLTLHGQGAERLTEARTALAAARAANHDAFVTAYHNGVRILDKAAALEAMRQDAVADAETAYHMAEVIPRPTRPLQAGVRPGSECFLEHGPNRARSKPTAHTATSLQVSPPRKQRANIWLLPSRQDFQMPFWWRKSTAVRRASPRRAKPWMH